MFIILVIKYVSSMKLVVWSQVVLAKTCVVTKVKANQMEERLFGGIKHGVVRM